MFKPGTRIERIKDGPVVRAGERATVIDSPVSPINAARGDDICILLDGDPEEGDTKSKFWRELDQNQPSTMSIADMLKTPVPA